MCLLERDIWAKSTQRHNFASLAEPSYSLLAGFCHSLAKLKVHVKIGAYST